MKNGILHGGCCISAKCSLPSPHLTEDQTKGKQVSTSIKIFPEIRQLKLLYQDNISGIEKTAMAVSLIGIVAVLVADIGIIGLVAFIVSQRIKEIAIRMALGASKA